MRTYRVKTITGQELTIEADQVDFGHGHVVFWKYIDRGQLFGSTSILVRALRTPMVAEVTEDREP